ncbi:hypothetical protein L596_014279 [Steinernema carpocapsae]|uniref:Uncharacterized protein n=1 Tax=Steinernema carpocapsae TaxID=34508 RepID=A0A4U5NBF2_STECR|nr:hypothetical protein L596_014279 [Steinernema carpocapsae]
MSSSTILQSLPCLPFSPITPSSLALGLTTSCVQKSPSPSLTISFSKMMTETSDETSVMPPASAPPEDTVATVAPTHAPANRRSSRRPSDHIQPPPEPFSPYAFPPTYEEAMVSKQLEEGNLSLTPEVIATLHTRTNCPGRPRRIASVVTQMRDYFGKRKVQADPVTASR